MPSEPASTDVDLGTILGVWAHPDDEAYLSAGLMALAVAAGRRVVCVTATAGELGFPDDDPRDPRARAAVRRHELAACLSILGVTEHRWLGYPDGGCAEVAVEVGADRIGAIIDEVRPDTLLTFGPDGATGHPDHIAVSRWSTVAVRSFGAVAPRLLYATHTPEWIADLTALIDVDAVMMVPGMLPEQVPEEQLEVFLQLDGRLLNRKIEALRAQHSQLGPIEAAWGAPALQRNASEEAFRRPWPTDPAW